MRQPYEFDPPLRIVGKGGMEIRSLDDWRKYGAPAGGSRQWRQGRSAMELARAWLAGGKGPRIPKEFSALLDSDSRSRGLAPGLVIPEMELPLDGFGGKTRTSDLGVYGRVRRGTTFVAVEAKADEPFGARTLGSEWQHGSSEKSNVRARIDALCRAIFFKPLALRNGRLDEELGPLRYQLLHGIAGAAFEAGLSGARTAVFAVHEFQTDATREPALARNQADFDAFIRALGRTPPTSGELTRIGNVRAPNGKEVETLIGKVRTHRS